MASKCDNTSLSVGWGRDGHLLETTGTRGEGAEWGFILAARGRRCDLEMGGAPPELAPEKLRAALSCSQLFCRSCFDYEMGTPVSSSESSAPTVSYHYPHATEEHQSRSVVRP